MSHYFSERLAAKLPMHRSWATDPGTALATEIDKLEKALLQGELRAVWGLP